MGFLTAIFFLASLVLPCLSAAQQPNPPAAPTSPQVPAAAPPPAPTQESSSTSKHKSKIPPFLIIGTVFNEHALAFPGVEIKIRRKGDKKFRYDTYTNSRGEFAIRVPQGIQYEMVVHAKGFADQTRTIDARNGSGENNVVFRMEPARRGKQ